MERPSHCARQYPPIVAGVEAITLVSDRVFPRHSHDVFGFGVVTSGAQTSWSGIGQVEAVTGDVIMVNPGEIHDGAPIAGLPRAWRMIYFDPIVLQHHLAEEHDGLLEVVRPVATDRALADCVLSLFASLTKPGQDTLEIEESTARTLNQIARCHGCARSLPERRSAPVAKALRRLNAAPESPTSLAELSKLAGISRFQLIRSFARDVGMTPHAYLIQARVRLARRLIAAGRPLAEAALDAGFGDQSHMTRAFVRQFGLTPGAYRTALA